MVKNRPLIAAFFSILLATAAAAVIGWLGFVLQQHGNLPGFFFPLIFPLLLGGLVGVAATMLGKALLGPKQRLLLAIAVVAGTFAVIAQTAGSYRVYAQSIETAVAGNSKAALAQTLMGEEFKPASPLRFVKTQIERSGGWWFLDAALIVLASVAASWYMVRRPQPEFRTQTTPT